MTRILAMLLALGLVAGCGEGSSGKDNPFQPDPEEEERSDRDTQNDPEPEEDDGFGDPTSTTADDDDDGIPNSEELDGDRDANGIRNSLQANLRSLALSSDRSTLTVEINGIDGTPLSATYARNASLDTGGYEAYSIQEDALDRLFVAIGDTSTDGSTSAFLVHGSGQFNRFINGGTYSRVGAFDPPDVGPGPGQGQVSYDGRYVGYSNLGSLDGENLLGGVAGEPDEVRPQEDARVVGDIFLNANFADNEVNGAIFNRVLLDPTPAGADRDLPSVSLILTEIDEDGRFFGDAEFSRRQSNPAFATINTDPDIGDYGGIFGGEDAESVAGVTAFEHPNIDPSNDDTEIEHGMFVLTQCGRDGDTTRCDLVEP